MYEKVSGREHQFILPDDFFLPFGGTLNKQNRWVKFAQWVPWEFAEARYAKSFRNSFRGQKAVSIRVALGSLIIQERLQLSDRDTVEQIMENPYLQYFIGLEAFQNDPPFHPSLMTHFRKRLNEKVLNEINEALAIEAAKECDHSDDDPTSGATGSQRENASDSRTKGHESNQGTLLLDATCAPADVAYPTDLGLLNEAREKLEAIIDVLHAPLIGLTRKPRTYRQMARKAFLTVAKQRRPREQARRRAIRKQLNFVARDLRIIDELCTAETLPLLSKQQQCNLQTIRTLHHQQETMHRQRSHRVDDRIVSISQPHVRPIVRGKAKARVEFGAKVSASMVNGYVFADQLSWDNFNEGVTLIDSVEAYKRRFGFYPKAVMADQVYRNRANRAYCKQHGIRLSGPPLGRPAESERNEQRQQARADAGERNAIEGKFGEGKSRYGLNRIRARLESTSLSVIVMQFLVMNLERRLRFLFLFFQRCPFGINGSMFQLGCAI